MAIPTPVPQIRIPRSKVSGRDRRGDARGVVGVIDRLFGHRAEIPVRDVQLIKHSLNLFFQHHACVIRTERDTHGEIVL